MKMRVRAWIAMRMLVVHRISNVSSVWGFFGLSCYQKNKGSKGKCPIIVCMYCTVGNFISKYIVVYRLVTRTRNPFLAHKVKLGRNSI